MAIKLTITEEHRRKAIEAVIDNGNVITNHCLVAQAVKEYFKDSLAVCVSFPSVYVDSKPYYLNENGRELTYLSYIGWFQLQLPIEIELEEA